MKYADIKKRAHALAVVVNRTHANSEWSKEMNPNDHMAAIIYRHMYLLLEAQRACAKRN